MAEWQAYQVHTHFVWSDFSLDVIKANRGDCRGQTAFEFFTLLLVAVTFDTVLTETGALIRETTLVLLMSL